LQDMYDREDHLQRAGRLLDDLCDEIRDAGFTGTAANLEKVAGRFIDRATEDIKRRIAKNEPVERERMRKEIEDENRAYEQAVR
jgi:hypothetical protein